MRLGKFTGKIYDDNYDFSQCSECCTVITNEQANDEGFINNHHIKDLLDCVKCLGCPEANR